MLYPTLAEQFARRQRDWKPNMNIVPTDPYLVDGVRTGYYTPPNADQRDHDGVLRPAGVARGCPSQQL